MVWKKNLFAVIIYQITSPQAVLGESKVSLRFRRHPHTSFTSACFVLPRRFRYDTCVSVTKRLSSIPDDDSNYRYLLKLDDEIGRHKNLYYNEASPEISDEEFDKLVLKAKDIIVQHPQWMSAVKNIFAVGATIDALSPIYHRKPMLSLDNAMTDDELIKFVKKTTLSLNNSGNSTTTTSFKSPEFVIEPKIDGLSASLLYVNGKFIRAGTRGDGSVGEDVTDRFRTIIGVPHQLPNNALSAHSGTIEIRGEVYMTQEDFYHHNESRCLAGKAPLSNPRNAAAGALRKVSDANLTNLPLRFFAYCIIDSTSKSTLTTQLDVLQQLTTLGFEVAQPYFYSSISDDILDICHKFEKTRLTLPYAVDGVVVKLNSFHGQELLGETSRAPRWAIAYKFTPEEAVTTLLSIVVQVGRTGVLTPVAVLDPVVLGGVYVERATLHNQDEVNRLKLYPGCRVKVKRSGDVIPKVSRDEG